MLDPDLVALVVSAFGLGAPVSAAVYADRGEQGRIWRLDTGRGSWALKEYDRPLDQPAAQADVAFQFAAVAAGLPLPRPRLTRDGRAVLPIEGAASAAAVRVYCWVDLAPGEAVTGAEVGAATAALHRLDHQPLRPPEAWFSEPIGAPAWQQLLSQATDARAGWAQPLTRWLSELVELDAWVAPPDHARLTTCHRDVNIENLRRRRAGGVVILDWENSGPGQPERELAAILVDLAADLGWAEAATAYQAYRGSGGPATIGSAADFSTAVAVQGHLVRFYAGRALDEHEPAENRARSRRRLAHMLNQPLTPTIASRLLQELNP